MNGTLAPCADERFLKTCLCKGKHMVNLINGTLAPCADELSSKNHTW